MGKTLLKKENGSGEFQKERSVEARGGLSVGSRYYSGRYIPQSPGVVSGEVEIELAPCTAQRPARAFQKLAQIHVMLLSVRCLFLKDLRNDRRPISPLFINLKPSCYVPRIGT